MKPIVKHLTKKKEELIRRRDEFSRNSPVRRKDKKTRLFITKYIEIRWCRNQNKKTFKKKGN